MNPIDISPSGFKYGVIYKITELNDYFRKEIADNLARYKDTNAYVWGQTIVFEKSTTLYDQTPLVLVRLPNTGNSREALSICTYRSSYEGFLEAIDGLKLTPDTDYAKEYIAGFRKKIERIEQDYGLATSSFTNEERDVIVYALICADTQGLDIDFINDNLPEDKRVSIDELRDKISKLEEY